MKAYYDIECYDCGETIPKGDALWMDRGDKLCYDCARDRGVICPKCRGWKNPEFDTCYECKEQ